MTRPVIVELSDDDVRVRDTPRFFRRVVASSNIGATYAGKYACFVAVVTDVELTEAQLDSLETQINAIGGVFNSFALVGSSRVPYDRLPSDTAETTYRLEVGLEAGFDMIPETVTP